MPPPPDPPFDIDTFEPIDPPCPAIREWVPADYTDPQAVFPEHIVSTHWVPKEIRLDDDRTLVLDPSLDFAFQAHKPNLRCQKNIGTAERFPILPSS